MKPLSIDQQIQVSRVFGWLSLMIEGTSIVRDQHEYVARAAQQLCPILNLDSCDRLIDNLWELGGLPERGLENDAQTKALTDSLARLADPLRPKPYSHTPTPRRTTP